MAKKVEINTEAPDFALDDYTGQRVSLSDFKDSKHVVLVFNRGFL
jgi:peroxiredoxin